MKKLTFIAIFAAIFISPALGVTNSTLKPLEPAKGKMLVIYEQEYSVKAGATEFLYGSYLSHDKKIEVRSVIDLNSKKSLMAKALPYKKGDRTISSRYSILIRFKEPVAEDTRILLQSTIVVYSKEFCYINDDGLWVTQWPTSFSSKFITPKGHIPVFTSHPVVISEHYGLLHLSQDISSIKNNDKSRFYRKLIFKTKPLPKKEK